MSPKPIAPDEAAELELAARRWLGMSLLVLVLAGLCALAVVVGRMPPFDHYVTDPVFFKRCLVAHVNLALVAWFYSVIAALCFLLPARRRAGALARHAVHLAAAGVALQLLGAAVPGARPLLSNYVPTIDHWVFRTGQLLFAASVAASLLDRRFLPGGDARAPLALPVGVASGLHAARAALLLAGLTLALTWLRVPADLDAAAYADTLVWGIGHVLQLACTAAMLAAWLWLLGAVLDEPPLSADAARWLFAALVLPWVFAPLFALAGTRSAAYQIGFTELMRWCILPVVSIFLALCLGALARAWRAGRIGAASLADPRLAAFGVSALLTAVGFGLGAAVRGQSTMVPAHYHASVGAITVAFMALSFVLLPALGVALPEGWLRRARLWQAPVYGAGMLVLSAGFALAGAHGMGRKLYGAEQAARSAAETLGLVLMGVGGFGAIAGGLLFVVVVAVAWARPDGVARAAQVQTRRLEYGGQERG